MAVRGGPLPALVLLMVVAAAGGCLGGAKDGSDAAADVPDDPTTPIDESLGGDEGVGEPGELLTPRPFAYAIAGQPRTVVWANDSFAATDSLLPAQAGGARIRSTNVSALLEAGVPTRLVANLSYEPGTLGQLSLTFRFPGSMSTSGSGLGTDRRIDKSAEFTPLAAGPYAVEVEAERSDAGGPLAYELRIEVVKLVDLVRPNVPVAVPIAEGGGLVFRMVGEPDEDETRRVTVALWGPGDELLGRFFEDTGGLVYPLPRNGTAGEYVAVVLQPPVGVTVEPFRAAPANTTMRVLRVVEQEGEPQVIAAGATKTWTFTPPHTPIQVGIVLRPQEQLAPGLERGTYDGRIDGAGPIFDFSGPSGRNDNGVRWSELAHENLTAGPFNATVTTEAGAYEATERWRMYERE